MAEMNCFMCGEDYGEGMGGWTKHFQAKHSKPPTEGARPITEDDGVQKEWYEQARQMTLEQLPEFLRHLQEDYHHDYGTICHAVAAGAVAAAWAMNKGPSGGITGFQAGAVMWQFITAWDGEKGPMRLLRYGNMLHPEYENEFARQTISPDTMKWLVEQAKSLLTEKTGAHQDVKAHWTRIAEGIPPFGLEVGDR